MEYNPLDWPTEHKIALAIAAVIGAIAGVIVGFNVSGGGYRDFLSWFVVRHEYFGSTEAFWHWGPVPWAPLGAAGGAIIIYMVKLLRH